MGNAGRVLMIPKGDYNAATTYEMLDFVYYQGRSYVCKQTSTGNVPTNTTYWQALTGDSSAEIQALTNQVNGLTANTFANGCVNLLPNKATPEVSNGITWVVNSDGTVSASGTATANSYVRVANINNNDLALNKGIYRFVACPSGGSMSKYYAYITDGQTQANDLGQGVEYNITNDNTDVAVILYVLNGQTVNITFKPMLTVADMPNSDYAHYVPYAKTNVELTADVAETKITMTLNSGFSVENTSSIIVKNGVCYFNPRIYAASNFSDNTAVVVATLPSNCRPNATITIPSYNDTATFLGVINIKANGDVEYKPSNLTRYFGYVNAAFPVV